MPDISIVIPCYNEADNPLLEKTFDSLKNDDASITLELIIVDDGSDDESIRRIKKILTERGNSIGYKIISTMKNAGIAMALNEGIKRSMGNYIMRIDCGDIVIPGRIKRQFYYLENNRHIALVGGLTKWIDKEGRIFSEYDFNRRIKSRGMDFRRSILYKNYLVHTTWMVRKELFNEIGPYNPQFVLEDYEFLVRSLAMGYNVAILPEYFTLISKKKDGLSGLHNKKRIQKSILLLKRKYIYKLISVRNMFGLLKSLTGYLLLTLFFPVYLRIKKG